MTRIEEKCDEKTFAGATRLLQLDHSENLIWCDYFIRRTFHDQCINTLLSEFNADNTIHPRSRQHTRKTLAQF